MTWLGHALLDTTFFLVQTKPLWARFHCVNIYTTFSFLSINLHSYWWWWFFFFFFLVVDNCRKLIVILREEDEALQVRCVICLTVMMGL